MISYCLSWGLYWFGDVVSRAMNGPRAYVLYPIYNWSMTKSYHVQNKYGVMKGPWRNESKH